MHLNKVQYSSNLIRIQLVSWINSTSTIWAHVPLSILLNYTYGHSPLLFPHLACARRHLENMKRTKRFRKALPSEPWPMIHVPPTTESQRPTSQPRTPLENSERLICIPFIKSWGKWPSIEINMPRPANQAPLFIYSTTRAAGDKPLIMIQHCLIIRLIYTESERGRTEEGNPQKRHEKKTNCEHKEVKH